MAHTCPGYIVTVSTYSILHVKVCVKVGWSARSRSSTSGRMARTMHPVCRVLHCAAHRQDSGCPVQRPATGRDTRGLAWLCLSRFRLLRQSRRALSPMRRCLSPAGLPVSTPKCAGGDKNASENRNHSFLPLRADTAYQKYTFL